MSKKKKQPVLEGAPEWMTTYGDMVTLLLTFFVMLVSMSSIQEAKFKKAMASLRKSFGILSHKMTTVSPAQNLIMKKPARMTGHINIDGLKGKHVEVKTIKQGKKIVIGGSVLFEKESAELKPGAYEDLLEIAEQLRGFKNKIEIRGHASSEPFSDEAAKYRDKWELSFYRAKAVADFMSRKGGIRAKRIRITGCGEFEKADTNLFVLSRDRNRRVEIIVSDQRIPIVEDTEEARKDRIRNPKVKKDVPED